MVPLSASSKRPMRSVRASVKAPFTWPKSSLSKVPSGSAPVLTATSGIAARERQRVQRLRDHFLAGTVLARDQDVGVRRPDACDGLQHRLHGRRGGDELRTAFSAVQASLRFQLLRTLQGAMQFDLGAQDGEQALVLPRLLDKVARAAAHGFDRQADIAPRGHDDDRHAAVERDDLRQQVEALLSRRCIAGVVQVDEDRVVKLASQRLAHRRRRFRGVDGEARRTQQQFERFEDVRLIVGRKNASRALAVARFAGGIFHRPGAGLSLMFGAKLLSSVGGAIHRILNLNIVFFQRRSRRALQLEL